jgi:hypothetical protein
MFVIYEPEGADVQRWEWEPKKVRGIEAEEIEARADVTWDQFQVKLLEGSARCRRVLLWHLLKKTHPTLKLADVDFTMGELKVEFSAPELHQLREQLVAAELTDGVDEQKRAAALKAIDAELESAPDADGAAGKAPSSHVA